MMLPAAYDTDNALVSPAPAPMHWYAAYPLTVMHVAHVFAAAAGFSEIWTVYCCIIMVETDVDVEIEVEVLVEVDVLVEVEVDVLVEVEVLVEVLVDVEVEVVVSIVDVEVEVDVEVLVDVDVVEVIVTGIVVVGVALAVRHSPISAEPLVISHGPRAPLLCIFE